MTIAELSVSLLAFYVLAAAHYDLAELAAFERRLRAAVAMCQIGWTDFCQQWLRIDPTLLGRQFRGEGRVDLGLLVSFAPREVRQVLALLEVRDLGLPSFALTAVQVHPLISQKEVA